MKIGQALMLYWQQARAKEKAEGLTGIGCIIPLESFLKLHYYPYVALCERCGLEPLSLGAWLRKPVQELA